MNKLAFCVPFLLVLAGAAQAQEVDGSQSGNQGTCPQLPADTGLTWEHRGGADSDFCRALRADGSEAFGLYIAAKSPFEPKRGNREEQGQIDGAQIHWYSAERAGKPNVLARETLVQLGNGQVAHIWLEANSPAELTQVIGQAEAMHFQQTRLTSN